MADLKIDISLKHPEFAKVLLLRLAETLRETPTDRPCCRVELNRLADIFEKIGSER